MLRNTQNKLSFLKKYSSPLFKVHENMRTVKPSMPCDVTAETVPDEFQMGITYLLCDMDLGSAFQHVEILSLIHYLPSDKLPVLSDHAQ
jgi:hypothetical protein